MHTTALAFSSKGPPHATFTSEVTLSSATIRRYSSSFGTTYDSIVAAGCGQTPPPHSMNTSHFSFESSFSAVTHIYLLQFADADRKPKQVQKLPKHNQPTTISHQQVLVTPALLQIKILASSNLTNGSLEYILSSKLAGDKLTPLSLYQTSCACSLSASPTELEG